MSERIPLPYYAILRRPRLVKENLEALHAAGRIDEVPTLFQVSMGVAYMVHRMLFRPDTIGVGDSPVRDTRRARLWDWRVLRFPWLVREKLIHPFELTGFATTPPVLRKHIIGAYHPTDHALYDMELLSAHEGELDKLHDEVKAIVDGSHPRAAFWKDLCVYQGYHDNVLDCVERALAGDFASRSHEVASDATVRGFVRFLCDQPESLAAARAAWRQGELRLGPAAA